MSRIENIIKEEVLGFIGEVSTKRQFSIEFTDEWQNMLRKVKTENNIDKVSIVGKGDDLSLQFDRKGHKPLNLGKIVRKHLRNEQYQNNIIQHILKHAPNADQYFQPKEKRVRKLPPTASVQDKIDMWRLVGEKANQMFNTRTTEFWAEHVFDKYGNYWNELYDAIKDTPEWEAYRQKHGIARDINFSDELA